MKKINTSAKQKGFSLIELMVVLVIIGVLTAIVISQFAKAAQKNRIQETTALIGTIQSTIHDVTQMNLGMAIDDTLLIRSDRIAKKYINKAGNEIVTPFGGRLEVNGVAGGTQYTIVFNSMSKQSCDSLATAASMSDALSVQVGSQTPLMTPIAATAIATDCDHETGPDYPLTLTFKR
ncbi:type II secretion system protein [Fastidiosibacter lacustris]|uniref:type II secretion system protein n=1 Tax=Fastidiosibacter lacustris TaxID=2056695 RepID=UPI0018640FE0|nr:type II secretion system protein [Fastidiosibacter lacustris]